MAVTIKLTDAASREWENENPSLSGEDLLRDACPEEHKKCKRINRHTFGRIGDDGYRTYPSRKGFVQTAISAYNHHYRLAIRPEDIWFAILTQLRLYVHANAEELRAFFVAHEGQKLIWLHREGNVDTVPFKTFTTNMVKWMGENVVHPDLFEWIMPDFTTEKRWDRVIASVLMMGTLQKSFTYRAEMSSGLKEVCLLGQKEDWQNMLERIEKLPQFGPEAEQFYKLLKPVLTRFVKCFEDPTGEDVKDFWSKIVHEPGGVSTHIISGWITAFTFWDQEGKSLYNRTGPAPEGTTTEIISGGLCLDETIYHRVEMNDMPAGYSSVPITMYDHTNLIEYKARMVAGSVGMIVVPSEVSRNDRFQGGAEQEDGATPLRTLGMIAPVTGWWMITESEEFKPLPPGSKPGPLRSVPSSTEPEK